MQAGQYNVRCRKFPHGCERGPVSMALSWQAACPYGKCGSRRV